MIMESVEKEQQLHGYCQGLWFANTLAEIGSNVFFLFIN